MQKSAEIVSSEVARLAQRSWHEVISKMRADRRFEPTMPLVMIVVGPGHERVPFPSYVYPWMEEIKGYRDSGGRGYIVMGFPRFGRLEARLEEGGTDRASSFRTDEHSVKKLLRSKPSLKRVFVHEMSHALRDRYYPNELTRYLEIWKRMSGTDKHSRQDVAADRIATIANEGLAILMEAVIDNVDRERLVWESRKYVGRSKSAKLKRHMKLRWEAYALGSFAALHYSEIFSERERLKRTEGLLKDCSMKKLAEVMLRHAR